LPPSSSSFALTGDGATLSIIAVETIAMKRWVLRRKSETTFVGWPT
jgi:hypothetical protein